MNPLDSTIQNVCPTVMVPRHEALTLLDHDSHRYLIGNDGFFVEIRRPWIHAIIRLVDMPMSMPYGQPPVLFSLLFDRRALVTGLQQFIAQARSVAPLEHAAWLTFKPSTGELEYTEPAILNRSNGHIQYTRPEAMPDSLPMCDAHSHGSFHAYFSGVDQVDDLNDDAKLAFVVGNLDQPTPSVAMRFVGLGLSISLSEWIGALLYDFGIASTHAKEIQTHD